MDRSITFGECDSIAKISADDYGQLGDILVERIRSVPEVVETKTLTGFEFLREDPSTLDRSITPRGCGTFIIMDPSLD